MRLELLLPREVRHPGKEVLEAWYSRIGDRRISTGSVEESHPARPGRHAVVLGQQPLDVARRHGKRVARMPAASKSALAIAAGTGTVAGSPAPPGACVGFGTLTTVTPGESLKRVIG